MITGSRLKIGLVKTTLIDFPGRVAAAVFIPGCNLRCPYCHNPGLTAGPPPEDFLTRDDLFAFLSKRKKILKGVAVTGGEPLFHPEAPALIRDIADAGFPVKLDTNGTLPKKLELVISRLSYIALDIKTDLSLYSRLGGDECSGTAIRETLKILSAAGVPFEIRTTLAPDICGIGELKKAAREVFLILSGAGSGPGDGVSGPEDDSSPGWMIQRFRPDRTLTPAYSGYPPTSMEEAMAAADMLKSLGYNAGIR